MPMSAHPCDYCGARRWTLPAKEKDGSWTFACTPCDRRIRNGETLVPKARKVEADG